MSVQKNLEEFLKRFELLKKNHDSKLILVSKTQPIEKIISALEFGQVDFGENKVTEGIEKFSTIAKDRPNLQRPILHHIGPTQSGTVRKVFGNYQFAHGVSSLSGLQELVARSKKETHSLQYFLQINLTNEDTKNGFGKEEIPKLLEKRQEIETINLKLIGFMTMGPSDGDKAETRKAFAACKQLRDTNFPEGKLSMGMSGDYEIALEFGSNFIRVGSAIFGERTTI